MDNRLSHLAASRGIGFVYRWDGWKGLKEARPWQAVVLTLHHLVVQLLKKNFSIE
jgi:hypothetical protein